MMMTSALCLVVFFGGIVAVSLLLVTNFRDSPKLNRPGTSVMLDLTPPALRGTASWHEVPDSLQHPLMPTLQPNTGWLGVNVIVSDAKDNVTLVGMARVPHEQAPALSSLEVVFESRSTGARVVCMPTMIGLPPAATPERKPVAIERATRVDREHATVVGFYVTRTMVQLTPAEYRVYAHVDLAHSNEQRLMA